MKVLTGEFEDALARIQWQVGVRSAWKTILWQFHNFLDDRELTSLEDVTAGDMVSFLYQPGRNEVPSRNTFGDRASVMWWVLHDRLDDLGMSTARTSPGQLPGQPFRPLTTKEMIDVQRAVPRGVMSVRVALAQAAMSSGEVCDVPVGAVDNPNSPSVVIFPDDAGRDRTYVLTEWGRYVVRERLRDVGGDANAFLAYEGSAPVSSQARRSAASKGLRKALDLAGLEGDPEVKPKSISHWGGVMCRQRGESPETVARLLGVRVENLPGYLRKDLA